MLTLSDLPELLKPGNRQWWYLDDATFLLHQDSVAPVWGHLTQMARLYGLAVNPTKCDLFNCPPPTVPEIPRVSSNGFELLGAVIGDRQLRSDAAEKIQKSLFELWDKLEDVDDPQVQLAILRQCVGWAKLTYFARTTPTADLDWSAYTSALQQSVQLVVGAPLSSEAWTQCTLPVALGGWGYSYQVN